MRTVVIMWVLGLAFAGLASGACDDPGDAPFGELDAVSGDVSEGDGAAGDTLAGDTLADDSRLPPEVTADAGGEDAVPGPGDVAERTPDDAPEPMCEAPCLHGGRCVAGDRCECEGTGYEGERCEAPRCAPGCANGGICVAPGACECEGTGFIGPRCDQFFCDPPCQNGGACVAPDTCDCEGTGFTGPDCGIERCGAVVCPELEGYLSTCNDHDHCEYARASPTEPWHADDVWIYLPPGSAVRGAPPGELGSFASERPAHTVTFAEGRWIAKYPVTVRAYEACEADGACTAPSTADWDALGWGLNRSSNGRGEHPQNGVVWEQAGDVCAWLGGRRATEAEWEYAAKGPDGHRRYPWGDAPSATCGVHAIFKVGLGGVGFGCNDGGTWPVGPLERVQGASAVGAHDMAGNVWEWVEDCWHKTLEGAPVDGSAWVTDCDDEPFRVFRGGSFITTASFLRAAKRNPSTPTYRNAFAGARCVRAE